jgi:hypothetical protein
VGRPGHPRQTWPLGWRQLGVKPRTDYLPCRIQHCPRHCLGPSSVPKAAVAATRQHPHVSTAGPAVHGGCGFWLLPSHALPPALGAESIGGDGSLRTVPASTVASHSRRLAWPSGPVWNASFLAHTPSDDHGVLCDQLGCASHRPGSCACDALGGSTVCLRWLARQEGGCHRRRLANKHKLALASGALGVSVLLAPIQELGRTTLRG